MKSIIFIITINFNQNLIKYLFIITNRIHIFFMSKYPCLHSNNYEPWKIHGVNFGGLFVLEPWITPSLFYQFLNKKDYKEVAMDMYTFCEVLGPTEGRRQLKEHFQKWVNESDIIKLVERKITHIRLPVGDWMFAPYEPYIGCTDDAILYMERILYWCQKHSLRVLIDLHGVRDSQNGLDNSGKSSNIEYVVAPTNREYDGALTFIHWSVLSGNWIGNFDTEKKIYTSINYENIAFTKNVLYTIIDSYKNHPAVFAIEPLNEPWIYSPINILQDFYYDVYKYMYQNAPHLKFIYHDSFRPLEWNEFLVNCSSCAMDWHIYQAWNIERYGDQFLLEADNYINYINNFKKLGIQLIIGEFSLATDNCAMWLNGFQDNIEGFPVTECKYTPCPFPYIHTKDFDRVSNIISPFGSGLSTPRLGTCPYAGIVITDDLDEVFLNKLALKKINSFTESQGWFFWNFKTEIPEEIEWSYISSFDNHRFRGTYLDPSPKYLHFLILIPILICCFVTGYVMKKPKKKIHAYVAVVPEMGERKTLKKHVSFGDMPYKYESIDENDESTAYGKPSN